MSLRRSLFAVAALLIAFCPMTAFSADLGGAGIHRTTEPAVSYPFNLVIIEPAIMPAVPRSAPRTPTAHSAVYRRLWTGNSAWRHVADCFRHIDPGRAA